MIGTISDVVYKDLEIEESVAGLVSGLIWSQMYSRLYDLYNKYYLDEELHMSIDDVDKRIDEILLESIRNAFILMNIHSYANISAISRNRLVCSFLRIKISMLMHLQRWSMLDGLRNDTACACFLLYFLSSRSASLFVAGTFLLWRKRR